MNYLQFRFSGFQLFGYRFRPSWLGFLITLCCIPVFIKLGLWQYHKAEQKQALQAMYDSYSHEPPVALPQTIAKPEEWRYRQVKVTGEYVPRYQILLDNQVDKGQVGYHVITPLRMQNTENYVLVDRGWIPAEANHSVLPEIRTPGGQQQVLGQVWLPSTKFFSFESRQPDTNYQSNWQALWQNMDMERYARSVPFQIAPVVLRLDAKSGAGGFLRDWPQPAERVTTNIGYAYQWFGFAAAAIVIFIVVSCKKMPVKDEHESSGS